MNQKYLPGSIVSAGIALNEEARKQIAENTPTT